MTAKKKRKKGGIGGTGSVANLFRLKSEKVVAHTPRVR